VPAAIEAALKKVVGVRDVTLDSPDTAVKVLTRRLKDADVFLFFNESARVSQHVAGLKSDGHWAEEWDPATGKVSPMAYQSLGGTVHAPIELKPYETKLVVVRLGPQYKQ
jgi:hypothetical protein